jgi:hypothetical protein
MKKYANAYDQAFRAKASTWVLNQVSLLDQEVTISFFKKKNFLIRLVWNFMDIHLHSWLHVFY